MGLRPYEYHINQVKVGKILSLKLNASELPWMFALIEEIQEGIDPKDLNDDWKQNIQLSFEGTLERFNEGQFKDHMFLSGMVQASFYTLEINTGEPIIEHLDFRLNGLILERELLEEIGLEEGSELPLNRIKWEVYPYDNQVFNFKEVLHELLFLNRDPYPSAKA